MNLNVLLFTMFFYNFFLIILTDNNDKKIDPYNEDTISNPEEFKKICKYTIFVKNFHFLQKSEVSRLSFNILICAN